MFYCLTSEEVAAGGEACYETRHIATTGFANIGRDLKDPQVASRVALPDITSASDQNCGLGLGFEAVRIYGPLLVPEH
jgi:hypothetical protein